MSLQQYTKSVLNAPKRKFLKPFLRPTPFSLQEEEDEKSSDKEIEELYLSSLNIFSDSSSLSSDEEKEEKRQNKLIKKELRPKLSGSSLDTKGTDSFEF